jgi:hypothetical protein
MKKKPGGLLVVCIAAIVLGGLGLLSGLSGIVMLAIAPQIQANMKVGNPNAMDDAVQAMQTKMTVVTDRWRPIQFALFAPHLLLAAGLVTGGILGLRVNPLGRTLLIYVFCGAILFEVIRLIPTIAIQCEMIPIMQEMAKDMQPKGKAGPGDGAVAAIMMGSVIVGLVIGIGMVLAKMGMYLWGALYLRKQEIVDLFNPEDPFAAQGIVR